MKVQALLTAVLTLVGIAACGASSTGGPDHSDAGRASESSQDDGVDATSSATEPNATDPTEADASATDANGVDLTGTDSTATGADPDDAGANEPSESEPSVTEPPVTEPFGDAGQDVAPLASEPVPAGAEVALETSAVVEGVDPPDPAAGVETFVVPTGLVTVTVRVDGPVDIAIKSEGVSPVTLATGNARQGSDGEIQLALPAGEYQVQISPLEEQVSYEVRVSVVRYLPEESSPEPGGDAAGAQDFGALGTEPVTVGGYVGAQPADEDYFRFELEQAATVILEAEGVVGRIYARFFEAGSDTPFASLDSEVEQNQMLLLLLPKGTYFVRLMPRSAQNTQNLYSFTLTAHQFVTTEGDPEPGSDKAAAQELGILGAEPVTVGGYVGMVLDDQDYYRFELTEAASLTITPASGVGRIFAHLYQDAEVLSEDSPFATLDVLDSSRQGLTMPLPRGVYFMRVVPRDASDWQNFYSLTLAVSEFATLELTPDPGLDKATAADLGSLGVEVVTLGGYVGQLDAQDYYRFELVESGTVAFASGTFAQPFSVHLYSDAEVINEAAPLGSFGVNELSSGTASLELGAGVYFLRVVPMEDFTYSLYELGVSVTP